MSTPRSTRARALVPASGGSGVLATPSPARRGVGRPTAAARPARRVDEGSESGGDDVDDSASERDGEAGAPQLDEGERATECCFWHEPTVYGSAAPLATRRFEPLHADGRGASAREEVEFVRAREAAHDAHVATIRGEVAQLVAQTNAHVFNGVIAFLRAHPPAERRLPLAIIATRCNAHDELHALAQLGAAVRAAGLSRLVVHVRAAECANVHTAVRAIAGALLETPTAGARSAASSGAGAGSDGAGTLGRGRGPLAKPNGCAAHDLRLIGRWYAARLAASRRRRAARARASDGDDGDGAAGGGNARAPIASAERNDGEDEEAEDVASDTSEAESDGAHAANSEQRPAAAPLAPCADEPIVVVLADADLLTASALDDVVYACGKAFEQHALPIALVAGVATSADSLIRLLPRTSLSRVRTTRFRLQPALGSLDEAILRIFLGARTSGARGAARGARGGARMLGVQMSARAFEQLCEQFLAETLSLSASAHMITLSSWLHFASQPLSFLAAAAPSCYAECAALARHLTPYHLARARALPSVRRALDDDDDARAELGAPPARASAAVGDDELRARVGRWLWALHEHSHTSRVAMLALNDGLASLAAVPCSTHVATRVGGAGGGAEPPGVARPTGASDAADGGEGGEHAGPIGAAARVKAVRWQLSLREIYCSALHGAGGVNRIAAHLAAELGGGGGGGGITSSLPVLGALGGGHATSSRGASAIASGRGPEGLVAFADAMLAALDGAGDDRGDGGGDDDNNDARAPSTPSSDRAPPIDSAAALERATRALRTARSKAYALLAPYANADGAAGGVEAVGAATSGQPQPSLPREQSAAEREREQRHWSAAKRRAAALLACAAPAQPAAADREREAAVAAARAMSDATAILVRGCLHPLRALPLGEIASGTPGGEAKLLREWCAPRVRETVEEGLARFSAVATAPARAPPTAPTPPADSARARIRPHATDGGGAAASTSGRVGSARLAAVAGHTGASAKGGVGSVGSAGSVAAPSGARRSELLRAGARACSAGGMGAERPRSARTVALDAAHVGVGSAAGSADGARAGARPTRRAESQPPSPARRATPSRGAAPSGARLPSSAACAPAPSARGARDGVSAGAAGASSFSPQRSGACAVTDLQVAHAFFSAAEARALNLAVWHADFERRLALARAGASLEEVLAREEPSAPRRAGKQRKSAETRRGDAKRRRSGNADAPLAAGTRGRARSRAPVGQDGECDEEDDEDELEAWTAGQPQQPQGPVDPELLARFIGAIGSLHTHGLVRASTRHPGHVIKMVFDKAELQ
ncbi:hypothetical protein KFE25_009462 [Diacronema lutheri]|uniref:Origin recognition complex subunit 3 N-terminal domain-containing protein n=1 Tax=Diacronema lutheri TaxID=2081491 RepID=A0A8J5XKK4_DIALT|nr:hypothetical protein KFE25_009462 [Diacronema lutheri]